MSGFEDAIEEDKGQQPNQRTEDKPPPGLPLKEPDGEESEKGRSDDREGEHWQIARGISLEFEKSLDL